MEEDFLIRNIVPIVAMILLTGIFAAIEAAILALNDNKIKMMAEGGEEKAVELQKYLNHRTKYLAAIQVGMVFCGLMAAVLTEHYFASRLLETIRKWVPQMNAPAAYLVSIFLLTLLLTYFIMVFGRFTPKRVGIKHAGDLVYATRKIQIIFSALIWPFVLLSNATSYIFTRMLGIHPKEVDASITEEEIRMMVDVGGDTGSIDENEKEMINNIFEFDNTMAGEIATHRTDIVAIPLHASLDDITKVISNEKYSRIPVYNENIDDIIGIFHVKDLVKYILNDSRHMTDEGFVIQEILMKPYFVPFTKKTDELFEEMQKEKIYMAIIIDEYGGTAGIVTMEDLLEEIVGNIFDEYDKEEKEDIVVINEHTFFINGTTALDEIENYLDIQFDNEEKEDYETIGGFLIGQLGRIPEEEELPVLNAKGYLFQIEKIEEKRIERIRATKTEKKKIEEEN